MLIKVCGITNNRDIESISDLNPDYMGFIFYPPSPRDVSEKIARLSTASIPAGIKKVAVLVNESEERALEIIDKYGFEAVQLHGNEPPAYCSRLKKSCEVIKSFRIKERLPGLISQYEGKCDLFLMDTAADKPGGTGRKFDHSILNGYRYETPFLLSGGIGPEDADYICSIRLKAMAGVDVNSRFETSPGIKSAAELEKFIMKCKTVTYDNDKKRENGNQSR